MNDAVNTFLEATRKEHEFTNKDGVVTSFFGLGKMLKVRPRFVCADEWSVSIQTGYCPYCSPRGCDGPYENVELGYPSAMEGLLMDYAEDRDRPTDTVYAYVPVTLVNDVIRMHGGPKKEEEETNDE